MVDGYRLSDVLFGCWLAFMLMLVALRADYVIARLTSELRAALDRIAMLEEHYKRGRWKS
jgi:hypothetical protein